MGRSYAGSFDAEAYRHAQALFDQFVHLSDSEREQALEECSLDDDRVLGLVRKLLQAHDASNALDSSAGSRIPDFIATLSSGVEIPETLGHFRIVRELGRGGMGIVYEAEQDLPRRRVALKAIAPHRESEWAIARFREEVQAMVEVKHSGIPQVYEVIEVDGLPLVAMELVEGQTLGEWGRHASFNECLDVLEQLAAILVFAHERGIVHRDLKPSNIMVTTAGAAKILDFGIAAALGDHSLDIGTLAYAAPEQLLHVQVDVRADVFSLGVVAWELLTRTKPDRGGKGSPSSSSSSPHAEPSMPRRTRALRRPLAAVLRRALADDPDDRYASMARFSADLRRVREHRPVAALRGDAMHWLYSHVRRLAPSVGLPLLGLTLVAIDTGVWGSRSPTEQPCAGLDDRLAQVWGPDQRDQIHTSLAGASPAHERDAAQLVVRLDDYASTWLDAATRSCEQTVAYSTGDHWGPARARCLDQRLLALDELSASLGAGEYGQLGVEDLLANVERLPAIERCFDLRYLDAQAPIPADAKAEAEVERLRAGLAQARALLLTGLPFEAREHAADLVEQAEALGFRPLTAEARVVHGDALDQTDAFADASASFQAAFLDAQASEHLLVAREAGVARLRTMLHLGRHDELTDEWMAIVEALHEQGADSRQWADFDCAVARHRLRRSTLDEALDHARRCLERRREILGDKDLDVAMALQTLAKVHHARGEYEDCIVHAEQAIELATAFSGPTYPLVTEAVTLWADAKMNLGERTAGLEALTSLTDSLEQRHGPNSTRLADHLLAVGLQQETIGHEPQAEANYRRALDIHLRMLGPDSLGAIRAHGLLGGLLCKRGDTSEGRAELEVAASGFRADPTQLRAPLVSILGKLAVCAFHLEDAELTERSMLEAVALANEEHGPGDPSTIHMLYLLGNYMLELGHPERALPRYERALELMRRHNHPTASIGKVLDGIAAAHAKLGQLDKAWAVFESAPPIDERAGLTPAERMNHYSRKADIHAARGEREQALEAALMVRSLLFEMLQIGPGDPIPNTQAGDLIRSANAWIADL